MAFNMPLWKTYTTQQALSFGRPKIWLRINHTILKVKNCGSYHSCFEERNLKQTVLINDLVETT